MSRSPALVFLCAFWVWLAALVLGLMASAMMGAAPVLAFGLAALCAAFGACALIKAPPFAPVLWLACLCLALAFCAEALEVPKANLLQPRHAKATSEAALWLLLPSLALAVLLWCAPPRPIERWLSGANRSAVTAAAIALAAALLWAAIRGGLLQGPSY